MTFKFSIFKIAILTSLLAANAQGALLQSDENALNLAFSSDHHVKTLSMDLNADQRKVLEAKLGRKLYSPQFTVYEVSRGNKFVGRAIKAQELGKHQPIDYLVAMDSSGRVVDLEILAYRETYGGQITRDSFRSQFKGKGLQDRLELGKGIDAVSGATISSKSMVLGVRKALLLNAILNSPHPSDAQGESKP